MGRGAAVHRALSDRWGRKHLLTVGMLTQASALAVIATADTFAPWATGAILLGAGTSMVYGWRGRRPVGARAGQPE